MTTITSVRHPPGRVWGVLSLIAVALPLPFLFALNVLSVVVRSQAPVRDTTAEGVLYGILAFVGLFLFPLFFVLALVLAVRAVTRPRLAGRVMGWITITVVILAIPAAWLGYLVWIQG